MEKFKKPATIAVIIFILLFAWGLSEAGELRFGVGFGATHDNGWVSQEISWTDRHWYAQITRLGGDEGGCQKGYCAPLPDTWRYSAGIRVNWRPGARVEPFLRLGAAYFEDEPSRIISERLTFDMAAGLRLYDVMELEWQHNSTAGRARRNWGNDLIMVSLIKDF